MVGGSLEYVIDEREDADWLRFLRAVDGRRPLGDLLAGAGRPEAVAGLLWEAVEAGVLAAATLPASRAAATTGAAHGR